MLLEQKNSSDLVKEISTEEQQHLSGGHWRGGGPWGGGGSWGGWGGGGPWGGWGGGGPWGGWRPWKHRGWW